MYMLCVYRVLLPRCHPATLAIAIDGLYVLVDNFANSEQNGI
jgi:hypothetical protein